MKPIHSFVTERDEIITEDESERALFEPYESPIEADRHITYLRARDPRGRDAFIIEKRPTLTKGTSAHRYVRELARDHADGRAIAWILQATPDTSVQNATSRIDRRTHPHAANVQPEHVYAATRTSPFKPELKPTKRTSAWKRYTPFEVHEVEHANERTNIAIPRHIRLSNLEEAMEARGTLEYYFPEESFGIESIITARLTPTTRHNGYLDENYQTRQVRRVNSARLEHREGDRFITHALVEPNRTVESYLRKTS